MKKNSQSLKRNEVEIETDRYRYINTHAYEYRTTFKISNLKERKQG